MKNFWEDAEVISAYTRADALRDGVLIDVSETAREAGFKWPVAITQALWATINNIPKSKPYQDVQGRLWDVLWMGYLAAGRRQMDTQLHYQVIMHHGRKKYITLKMVSGPGDDGEGVITIMLPHED